MTSQHPRIKSSRFPTNSELSQRNSPTSPRSLSILYDRTRSNHANNQSFVRRAKWSKAHLRGRSLCGNDYTEDTWYIYIILTRTAGKRSRPYQDPTAAAGAKRFCQTFYRLITPRCLINYVPSSPWHICLIARGSVRRLTNVSYTIL